MGSQVMIPQLHSFSNFGCLVYLVVVVTLVVAASEDDMVDSSRIKRQVYQPPHVDEKLVSAFINNPEAVKMVMSYLKKQKSTTPPPRTTTPSRLDVKGPAAPHLHLC